MEVELVGGDSDPVELSAVPDDDSVTALVELSITIPLGCVLRYIGCKLEPKMKMERRCDGGPTQLVFEAANRMALIATRTIPPHSLCQQYFKNISLPSRH